MGKIVDIELSYVLATMVEFANIKGRTPFFTASQALYAMGSREDQNDGPWQYTEGLVIVEESVLAHAWVESPTSIADPHMGKHLARTLQRDGYLPAYAPFAYFGKAELTDLATKMLSRAKFRVSFSPLQSVHKAVTANLKGMALIQGCPVCGKQLEYTIEDRFSRMHLLAVCECGWRSGAK